MWAPHGDTAASSNEARLAKITLDSPNIDQPLSSIDQLKNAHSNGKLEAGRIDDDHLPTDGTRPGNGVISAKDRYLEFESKPNDPEWKCPEGFEIFTKQVWCNHVFCDDLIEITAASMVGEGLSSANPPPHWCVPNNNPGPWNRPDGYTDADKADFARMKQNDRYDAEYDGPYLEEYGAYAHNNDVDEQGDLKDHHREGSSAINHLWRFALGQRGPVSNSAHISRLSLAAEEEAEEETLWNNCKRLEGGEKPWSAMSPESSGLDDDVDTPMSSSRTSFATGKTTAALSGENRQVGFMDGANVSRMSRESSATMTLNNEMQIRSSAPPTIVAEGSDRKKRRTE
ncbi:hypothetical protein GGR50DRAFT_697257 [Xylaria sp. CBS 124048]|nr:hypothetical protein GGR50DRAFT_697257 [Xylaria sp. CBS 124048]